MKSKRKEHEELQTTKQAYEVALQNTTSALQVVLLEDPDHTYKEYIKDILELGKHALTYGKLP